MNTPNYIKSLVIPQTKRPTKRNAWGIDFATVWLPFFTACNAMGDTHIASDAIGCPLRVGYDKTGAVKFSQSGRPVIRVAKDLSDSIRLVHDNFTANLLNFAGAVIRDNNEAYRNEIETARLAGEPIAQHDRAELDKALKSRALAEAEAILAKQSEAKTEAKTEAEAVPA